MSPNINPQKNTKNKYICCERFAACVPSVPKPDWLVAIKTRLWYFIISFKVHQKQPPLGIPGFGKMPSIIINSNANMRWYKKKTDTFAKEWKGCYTCSKVNQVNRLPSNVNTAIFPKFQSSWKMQQALKTPLKVPAVKRPGRGNQVHSLLAPPIRVTSAMSLVFVCQQNK